MKAYLVAVGDAISQLLNAVFLNSRNPNQAISSRCWEQRYHWFFRRLKKVIDWVAYKVFKQDNHCEKSWQRDLERAEAFVRTQKQGA